MILLCEYVHFFVCECAPAHCTLATCAFPPHQQRPVREMGHGPKKTGAVRGCPLFVFLFSASLPQRTRKERRRSAPHHRKRQGGERYLTLAAFWAVWCAFWCAYGVLFALFLPGVCECTQSVCAPGTCLSFHKRLCVTFMTTAPRCEGRERAETTTNERNTPKRRRRQRR